MVVEGDALAAVQVDVLERVTGGPDVEGERVRAVAGLDAVAVASGFGSLGAVGVAQRGERS